MYFYQSLNNMEYKEFQNLLPQITSEILSIIYSDKVIEMRDLTSHILLIDDPRIYTNLMESLFVTNQKLYLRFVHDVSPEVASKRRKLSG